MANKKVTYIDEAKISDKRVLLRADFDVSLNPDFTIADDIRIRKNIPTIQYLLKNKNKVICVAKLGRPEKRDTHHSLKIVVTRLKEYLPDMKITLIDDFLTADKKVFENQKDNEILVLENIRFYPEEKKNDPEFIKKLASLADVFVNDAFSMCHRSESSVTGVPSVIPGYGGLLLKKEIEMISKSIKNPKKPFVAIIGGSKISSKVPLLNRLIELADYILLGGGLANIFLVAQGKRIRKPKFEEKDIELAKSVIRLAKRKNTMLLLPTDCSVAESYDAKTLDTVSVENVSSDQYVLDIGPETRAQFGWTVDRAKTIIWNGPLGYIENPEAREGTDFIYYCVAENSHATSIAGGGDTLAAISKKEYLDKITHISTGGGAMLEYIENGTLPGLEALKNSPTAESR